MPQRTSHGRASADVRPTAALADDTATMSTAVQPLYGVTEASMYVRTTSRSTSPNAFAILVAKRVHLSPGWRDMPKAAGARAVMARWSRERPL